MNKVFFCRSFRVVIWKTRTCTGSDRRSLQKCSDIKVTLTIVITSAHCSKTDDERKWPIQTNVVACDFDQKCMITSESEGHEMTRHLGEIHRSFAHAAQKISTSFNKDKMKMQF